MLTQNRRVEDLQPYLQFKYKQLVSECSKQGIRLQLIETRRSQERQTELYKQGVGPKLIGPHGAGLAFDVAPLQKNGTINWNDHALFREMGQMGKSLGLEWGGDWKTVDCPHFQFTGGLKDEEIRSGKLPKFPAITTIKDEGGLDIMDSKLNLKSICKGKLKGTLTLECCSQPSNSARTGVVLGKMHEPFNIYAKAIDDKGNEWFLVNINSNCIRWVAASGVQLVL